jgi:hypothetical protein
VSVEQDWYIVESTDGDESTMANYAYLHVDTAKGEAQVFLSGANDAPAFEGSYACGTDVCFDDLKDYSAYAEEQIRQGIPPDSTYYVTLTE